MKTIPTREQVLDALQTHKTVQKAAKALGLSYPKMQYWLKKYGIVCNHNAKQVEPETSAPIIILPLSQYEEMQRRLNNEDYVSKCDLEKAFTEFCKDIYDSNITFNMAMFNSYAEIFALKLKLSHSF